MTTFAILVKSHGPDLDYATRLLSSYARHNVDAIPLYLVVPDVELPLFADLQGGGVTLLGESCVASHLVDSPVNGYSSGYINQEIVKLSFWETGLAENYLCLDSDAQFVRDFHLSDFMVDDTTPYTFLSEDFELRVEPEYYAAHWRDREPRLRAIQREIGLAERRLLTVHGHAVFSATVLRAFRDRFLATRGWDYVDALRVSPYEPTWYSMWLQKDRTIPIVMREPIFKTFHNATQHLDYVLRGVSESDIARGFVGVIVNSNYSRGSGMIDAEQTRSAALAAYIPVGELVRSALYSVWVRVTCHGGFWSCLRHRIGALLGRGPS